MNFELVKVRWLILPDNVKTRLTAGVHCIVCNHVETFNLDEYFKRAELRTRLMSSWVDVFVHPALPCKHFCKSCAPSIGTHKTKHKQTFAFAYEEEERRRMCLFN